ncbi:thymidylate kinase, putative [Trypanosoma vivax Y486]|uniref:Thymidylate kinase, putative n=1 Tax=Trypanosoma vivax (strain Y486) TaxID=1055687 RepID=F9WTZ9_TRYVY|nr:thymidylate kinase, putative [Trypanosoma vivax Y486]|eukprot:CCD21045.1 thymidylate kinase, putative [Trypanosoma vivax Y486]
MTIIVFFDCRREELISAIHREAGNAHDAVEMVPLSCSLMRAISCKERRRLSTAGSTACFVTEKTLEHADVIYAVYCKRIPVLSLTETNDANIPLYESAPSLGVPAEGSTLQAQLSTIAAFFLHKPSGGRIIVFEGGDGVGKATQAWYMAER